VCRSISAGEVDTALGGLLPATTADGVKRRAGAGFGDCQGNGCLAEVTQRIAAASGLSVTGVCRGLSGSWIVAGELEAGTGSADGDPGGGPLAEAAVKDADLVVVGAGLAGIGAAVVAADSGMRVVVIDRRVRPGGSLVRFPASAVAATEAQAIERFRVLVRQGSIGWLPGATAVGLREAGDAWIVEVEGDGSQEVRGAQVLLATGGYLAPREQLAVPGPRLSGIVTADFVHDALDRGWLPGTRAVVVGSGRVARGTVDRLEECGVSVVARVSGGGMEVPALGGVRGEGRLSGVLVDGGWLDADTLVLAHALRPATFLLRGLGIGDERPGVAAPADADGRLPLPGLWAAGTCRTPDIDHAGSLADGASVAAAITAAARAGATAR
jgi:thioredoxin reductase